MEGFQLIYGMRAGRGPYGELVESALAAGLHDLIEVRVEEGEDDLGLGVAESAVVLEDLDALGGEHQAGVENALVGASLSLQSLNALLGNEGTGKGIR